ncbi:MAG: DNA polymerase III subunit delta' [Armatimonadetes bacterium]|nr:DNA polymerase III subunit delta' [Armatimonadota bacterium]
MAEMIGQELASTVLSRAILDDRVAHAYGFVGPEGIGKMTAALAFAAALNCESHEPGDACGKCVSCRMIDQKGLPDVEIISPDGAQTKIDQMREMRRTAQFAPVRGKRKVVIVEQADTLNENSASAILKILEEPPPYLVIILLVRNPAMLLPTIRSRCLVVRFAYVNVRELAQALVERFDAKQEEAEFLAAFSEGRPGIAISLLGNESFFAWRNRIAELAERIVNSDLRAGLRLSEDLQSLASAETGDGITQRSAMRSALTALLQRYRDLLSISVHNSDGRGDPGRISRAIEALLWARRAVEGNANLQLTADVLMLRLVR